MDVQTVEQCRTEKDSIHSPAGNSSPATSHHAGSEAATAEVIESLPADGRQSLESVSSTENLVLHPQNSNPEHIKNFSSVEEIEAKSEHFSATTDGTSKYDVIYESIEEGNQNEKTKSRRSTSCYEKTKLNGDGVSKTNGNVNIYAGGRKVGKFAASCAADCAAVCCCPCLVVHVLFLAVVKVPFACARKAFSFAKKKTVTYKKDKDDDVDSEIRSKKARSYSMAWSSLRESPTHSGPVESGSSSGRLPVDPNKVWVELYAAGHMGFAGPPIERH